MQRLTLRTPNKADENFRALAAMFPGAVTETTDENGEVVRAIDKDVLMQEISCKVVDGREERYQFTWPDKRKAVLLANAPTDKTLRPCRGESADFDTTGNLYIEGDNLDALKLLQETYLGKIKMIYIDPPYNTGNDFVYEDDFAQDTQTYRQNSGQYDGEGNRLVQNTESNGRFHTDWLNMMYPRLRLARDLLSDDGVIFISIDDNEVENLKKICNEILGSQNFYSTIVWQKRTSPDARFNLGAAHDYILVFAKNWDVLRFALHKENLSDERCSQYKNPDNDPRGVWASVDITGQTGHATDSQYYEIITPAGIKMKPPIGRCWALAKSTFEALVADNRIWFGENGDSRPRQKKFLSEADGGNAWTWWTNIEVGHNQEGAKDVKNILGASDLFTNPKPIRLIHRLLRLITDKDSIILDFFSGSATTAHAVMQLNAEDGGNRRFIMVQLPEPCGEKSEAYKAGYKNICEIGKERIRRAGARIREENKGVDTGFRVLKIDSSNMKDVYYSPAEFDATLLAAAADNIKEDRTPEDLLFQVMLDLGILLSSRIEETTIAGKKAFDVADGYLIACFDSGVDEAAVTEIARQKPHYFVMRDPSGISDGDSLITNFEQIFATYSPGTVRRVM